jgi:hypothetical protein
MERFIVDSFGVVGRAACIAFSAAGKLQAQSGRKTVVERRIGIGIEDVLNVGLDREPLSKRRPIRQLDRSFITFTKPAG